MSTLSAKLGGDTVQRSGDKPSRFERILLNAGMGCSFWSKQAALQTGLLLGCVTLNTIARAMLLSGHRPAATLLANVPVFLAVGAIIATDKMARRQARSELSNVAEERRHRIPDLAVGRIIAGAALAIGILVSAHNATPNLSKKAYATFLGPEAAAKAIDRLENEPDR